MNKELLDYLIKRLAEEIKEEIANSGSGVDENVLKELLKDYVKNTDYASEDKAGVVKVNRYLGQSGLWMTDDGQLSIMEAAPVDIDCRQPMAVITASNIVYAIEQIGKEYFATSKEIGDISAALDELHAYAQALINGGAE